MKHARTGTRSRIGVLLVAALGMGAMGCSAKVEQDVFDREIAQIRSDMEGIDSRVSANGEQIAVLSERLDELQASLEDLREEYDVAVMRLENGLRFTTPVHFEFDRAEVRPEDTELLDRFADIVGDYYEGALVTVEGFADPAGSAAYNQDLSERRARSVASYLRSEGALPAEMLRTVGYGENRQVIPGAQGPGDAGLENRRVTFVIEYAPAKAATTQDMTASNRG